MTTTDASICSCASSSTMINPRTNSAATRKPENASTAFRVSTLRPRAGFSTTTETAHSPMSAGNPASQEYSERPGALLWKSQLAAGERSEEHTSELQSLAYLV